MPDEEVIVVRAKALMEGAKARCALCGKTRNLGRIAMPYMEYGVVCCDQHAQVWMDAVVGSFTDGKLGWGDILRDVGLF